MGKEIEVSTSQLGGILKTGAVIVLVIFALVLLSRLVYTVPAGGEGVLFDPFRGGVQSGTMSEGIHIIMPWTYVQVFEVRTVKFEAHASAASKDLQVVNTQVALNYHVEKGAGDWLFKNVGVNYEERIIVPAIQESVKATTAKYNAAQLIENRYEVKEKIQEELTARLAPYHITVETISITNFDFSPEFNQAIEAKQVAQQNAERAEYELQKVQVEAQQNVARAEANAQAAILSAEGDANATRIRASADAYAIQVKRDQLNPTIIQYSAIMAWDGKLPAVTSSYLPFLDISTQMNRTEGAP